MSNKMGEKFRLIRERAGLTQSKFSELVGISFSSYKKYETGVNEVGAPAIMAVANHPEFKKYALWLITDESNPDAGQFSPLDDQKPKTLITKGEYEQRFIDEAIKSLQTFGYLDWVEINTEKMDFEAYGKLLFKDLQEVVEQYYGTNEKVKAG
ncbi:MULTISPECIES: helix-turn-helix domain-containing protein [Pseudoalteromonas]|uniref:helix-turn-helix domain-containing protein n=1 Tax=Pseudoalteromonas TaxID=53246 RepID=UPI001BB28710|nr:MULTISPECIES: helix-turn-helix transcriptional regulator [Pseudoalteromonas]QZO12622.1 helix-turn-helix transcriptional regulator [Pseudoalteromonas piscicida]